jgi:hypothetical protein
MEQQLEQQFRRDVQIYWKFLVLLVLVGAVLRLQQYGFVEKCTAASWAECSVYFTFAMIKSQFMYMFDLAMLLTRIYERWAYGYWFRCDLTDVTMTRRIAF